MRDNQMGGGGGRGRGEVAVADMKARIAAMKSQGMDSTEIIDVLWKRNAKAVLGDGHVNDMAGAR